MGVLTTNRHGAFECDFHAVIFALHRAQSVVGPAPRLPRIEPSATATIMNPTRFDGASEGD